MNARTILIVAWLVAAGSLVGWAASRTFHIGRMPLPREQAVAVALTVVTLASVALAWGWLVVVSVRQWRWADASGAWVEHPLARLALVAVPLLAMAAYSYGRWVEPRWIVVREVPLGEQTVDAVRVAVISDLHVDGDGPPWSHLHEVVNGTDPDVVVFLGDALNRRSGLTAFKRTLRGMHARHAKLAVRGNWETWYRSGMDLLGGTGFEWLDRRAETLEIRGRRLHVVGFPYRDVDEGDRAERMLANLPVDGWRVFAYHTPDLVEQVPSADLYLAGHTHGGQIALPGFGALVTLSTYGKRFERGLHRVGDTSLYVNPGIGVEPMVPLRIGVRPEVTLLLLAEAPRAKRAEASGTHR